MPLALRARRREARKAVGDRHVADRLEPGGRPSGTRGIYAATYDGGEERIDQQRPGIGVAGVVEDRAARTAQPHVGCECVELAVHRPTHELWPDIDTQ